MIRTHKLSRLLFSAFFLVSCSKVLSKRTDTQAWIEFDQELLTSRSPASQEPHVSDEIVVFRERLQAIPVREVLLKCGHGEAAERCFQETISRNFDEVFRSSKGTSIRSDLKTYTSERNRFLKVRAFSVVLDEVNRFHQSQLSGLDLKAREQAIRLIEHCDSEKIEHPLIESFGVLPGISYEMPKSTYACLSSKINEDWSKLIKETSDRLGFTIESDAAKQWIISEQLNPVYETEMNHWLQKKQNEERVEFEKDIPNLRLTFKSQKNTEVAWVRDLSGSFRAKYPHSPVEQWIFKQIKESKE